MTKQELIKYAKSVHFATTGEPLEMPNTPSDHPFEGINVDVMSEFVNGDLVKKFVKDNEKALKDEMNTMYSSLQINTPVKITKGSKEKRGMEGFILHTQEPLQGSGKALFVYDVINHKSCIVRDSATKVRIPSYGERDLLNETYQICNQQQPYFTCGNNVELKADTNRKGFIVSDAKLDPNLNGNGFYMCDVQWADNQSPQSGTYILSELNLVK